MAKQLQLRGGTTAEHSTFIGAPRELTIDTDLNVIVVHDGITPGGFPVTSDALTQAHVSNTTNPHSVTAAQVGLGNVNNTADSAKIVASAGKWTTARTVTLTGAVTGSVSIDGSANVSMTTTNTADPVITLSGDVTGSATLTNLGSATITTTVADDSHNHIIANVDGLQTALDGKLGASSNAVSATTATKWNGASKTVSTSAASGGVNGDVWFQYA